MPRHVPAGLPLRCSDAELCFSLSGGGTILDPLEGRLSARDQLAGFHGVVDCLGDTMSCPIKHSLAVLCLLVQILMRHALVILCRVPSQCLSTAKDTTAMLASDERRWLECDCSRPV